MFENSLGRVVGTLYGQATTLNLLDPSKLEVMKGDNPESRRKICSFVR